ncbi:MAG: hypothetical protein DRP47_12240 [Candidatus Zixiibacteriota bacterium]|nr:MAG: hypothetical protein DRP47_12240 [candidate division Zixibacteria bacterium]
MRAGANAWTRPAFVLIKFTDQFQQLKGASIQMRNQFGDAIGHAIKLDSAFMVGVTVPVSLCYNKY